MLFLGNIGNIGNIALFYWGYLFIFSNNIYNKRNFPSAAISCKEKSPNDSKSYQM